MSRNVILTLLLGLLALGLAEPAFAQGANPAQIQPGLGVAKPRGQVTRERAPPALPGARAEPNQVAPASRNAMDLPPNEALFDAVNRGDLAVAKDAVSRGADLNATNVLGLTPIELSVDLGRNQISFFLMSVRGAPTPNPAGAAAAAKPPTRAERLATDRAERAEKLSQRVAQRRGPIADATPAAPQTPRLFTGGGGSPNPQAGFLGFDAGR